jgi:hypothetical protein
MLLLLSYHNLKYDINNIINKNKSCNDFININKDYDNNSILYLLYNIIKYYTKNINYVATDNKNFDYKKYNFQKNYQTDIFKYTTMKYNFNYDMIIEIIKRYFCNKNIFEKVISKNNIDNIIDINKSNDQLNNIIRCFLSVYPYYGYIDDDIFYDYTCNKYKIDNLKYIKYNKCFISYISKEIKYINDILFIELICPNVIDENIICNVLFSGINVKMLNKYKYIFYPIIQKYNSMYNNNEKNYNILYNNSDDQFKVVDITYDKKSSYGKIN